MPGKLGVFICNCSNNISNVIDTEKLGQYSEGLEGVTFVKIHNLLCSEAGVKDVADAIKANKLKRVVVAACSPKLHEKTFRKALEMAGLNPYMLQMANIREQIAWVTPDKEKALLKAQDYVKSAVERVKTHKPLKKSNIKANPDFVVIGGGVAGMSAALRLASKGRRVSIIEKEPWIGGKVASFEEVFPEMDCAPCMIEPMMSEVLHHDNIDIYTHSEIINLTGFLGNFQVQVKKKAKYISEEKCIGCGACYEPCPVEVKNKYNSNLSYRHAVYTGYPGALPNIPIISEDDCLRFGSDPQKTGVPVVGDDTHCEICKKACMFDAVDYEDKDKILLIDAGAIIVATGFKTYSLNKVYGESLPVNLMDSFTFERILSSTGPTEGKLITPEGNEPKSIAFIHCAGSRDKEHKEYCSGVCCTQGIKQARLARHKTEGRVKIYHIYSSLCFPGKGYEEFYNRYKSEKSEFVHVENTNNLEILLKEGKINIKTGKLKTVSVDIAVALTAFDTQDDNKEMAEMLGVTLDKYGFMESEHEKMSPSSSVVRGIYLSGTVTGPKDISNSIMHGMSAAGMAMHDVIPGETLELEVATASSNPDICCGCKLCVRMCPYQAIGFDEERNISVVNEVLCKGCGTCVAACPSGAMTNKHFEEEQIMSEIVGMLRTE